MSMFLTLGAHLRTAPVIAAVAVVIAGVGASSPARAGTPPPLNPALLTDLSKSPDQAADFLRFTFGNFDPVTLAAPTARRTFATYTAFFEPPLPLAQAVRYPGLEPVEDASFIAFRCKEPDLALLQPVLAKWPEVFNAILLDLGPKYTCPPPSVPDPVAQNASENEILCIVEGFDNDPMRTASQVLEKIYDTAAIITDRMMLQATLQAEYGIAVGFSGLGLSVKGSGAPSFFPTIGETVLDNAIIPEYLVQNVAFGAAGCRCIKVPPYAGRDLDPVDPDFIWEAGGAPRCNTVDRLVTLSPPPQ
jgi:hypothetical protein